MSAYVEHEFEKGFILDEERIRKINDLLGKRLPEDQGYPKPTYKVYRADSFTYTTLNVQDIIEEENTEWQKIERITVSVKAEKRLELELDFDVGHTALTIEGEDRDLVFLLFSDLRQYLSSVVNIYRRLSPRTIRSSIAVSSFLLLLLGFAVLVLTPSIPEEAVRLAIGSQDITEKLDFLISRSVRPVQQYASGGLLLIGVGFALYTGVLFYHPQSSGRIVSFVSPHDLFLFGKEMDRHTRRLRLRSNIFWVIIVGTVVSLITGLVVWIVTK